MMGVWERHTIVLTAALNNSPEPRDRGPTCSSYLRTPTIPKHRKPCFQEKHIKSLLDTTLPRCVTDSHHHVWVANATRSSPTTTRCARNADLYMEQQNAIPTLDSQSPTLPKD